MADDNTEETSSSDTNSAESGTDHSPEAAQVGTSDGDGESS